MKDLNYSEILNFDSIDSITNGTRPCEKWEYNFTTIPYASIGTEVK